MKDSTKKMQKQHTRCCKNGILPIIADEAHFAVPSSKEKVEHVNTMREKHVEKPRSEE